jgi:hypothetical protein
MVPDHTHPVPADGRPDAPGEPVEEWSLLLPAGQAESLARAATARSLSPHQLVRGLIGDYLRRGASSPPAPPG